MKAKLTDPASSISRMTLGKIYDVEPCDYDKYWVINDDGVKIDLYKWRFEAIQPSLIEAKTAEIEATREKLEILEKELADLTAPKVGDKFNHNRGKKYILAEIDDEFVLVCYDGDGSGQTYGSPVEKTESVFQGNEEFFTPIP